MIRLRRVRAGVIAVAIAALGSAGCGKKGPPLPPLVLLPTPPGDFSAVRRGDTVELTFRIPNSNTDRSTPADIERVEVYAWTAPGPVTADDVVRRGSVVARVDVNKPKDPDEPEPETPAPKGPGLDQDEVTTVADSMAADADATAYRVYVAVGFNRRGRRGALSQRISVPLVEPPPAPEQPQIAYDDKAITLSWKAIEPTPAGAAYGYAVYAPDAKAPLNAEPAREPRFVDNTVEWEKERCYEVRTVAIVESVRIESAPSQPACVTPHDTFPPVVPQGLVGVGSQGTISLIWTANTEADLAGYLVLRALEPETELKPITPTPIPDTNFRDTVPAGVRATYAVVAVDKAGNLSAPSNRIAETAR